MNKVSFSLNVAEVKNKLNPVFSVIKYSVVLPILEDVLVVQNGRLKMSASDLENFVSVFVDNNSDEFSFCIEKRILKPFVKNALSEVITFRGDENNVSMGSGDFKLSVPLNEKSGDFPKEPVFETGKSLKINSKKLSELFTIAGKFVSKDDLRPAMSGINLCDYDENLTVVSTDAHRLFHKPLMETPDDFKGLSIVIPIRTSMLFIEMFHNEDIEIRINENYIFFIGKDKELSARLVDAKFPIFGYILKSIDKRLKFSLQRKQLLSFINIAENFTNYATNQTTLEVDSNRIKFIGGDIDYDSEFNYNLPIYNSNINVEKFEFAVNIKYLKNALSVNKKDEYVTIEHSGSATKSFEIDGCLLLMPLMTNQ